MPFNDLSTDAPDQVVPNDDSLPFSDPYVPDGDPDMGVSPDLAASNDDNLPDGDPCVPEVVLAEARNLIAELSASWPDEVGDVYSIASGWDLHVYAGVDNDKCAVLFDRVGVNAYALDTAQ